MTTRGHVLYMVAVFGGGLLLNLIVIALLGGAG